MMSLRPQLMLLLLTGIGLGVTEPATADIGRLFFSPAERAALERARSEAAAPPAVELETSQTEIVPQIIEESAPVSRPAITLDGYVSRSDGSATLWVNGENSYEGDLAASHIKPLGATVRGSRVRLVPFEENTAILLKPGESYNPNTGTTIDIYEVPPKRMGPEEN